MHVYTNLTSLFFHFVHFSSFILVVGTPILTSSSQTQKKPCFTNLDLEGSLLSLILSSSYTCSLSLSISSLPSASFSSYPSSSLTYSPQVYCQDCRTNEAKQNALDVTVEKESPWEDSCNCGARGHTVNILSICHISHPGGPGCIPISHQGTM